ncbi:S8 family serine peptidase, partial [Erythrobacter sp.]|uniref:S8 family peptidase n=1 Tax=Erythrobacter sp. TaxID=1042 RepID=UPI003C7241C4
TTNFNTEEFRQSDGPGFHGAITAWRDNATGSGEVIAVIDSGIDTDSPEFAGRIHPDSRDVAGSRGLDPENDHGTNVAMIAAAARDDRGILGMAFDAQVLAIRADRPGSCGNDTPQDPTLGCQFTDSAIADGIDLAVNSNATVVNISLGGGPASSRVRNAVARAAAAGVVVVVSAGNGGDGSNPDIDPNEPDPFALDVVSAGNGNVIIVGSVDPEGNFSDFSNRAGASARSFLSARGQRICCVYEDGELFIDTIDGSRFITLFSGTSFAAPQVSGAVALLAQAFPNLTAQEITDILLATARDAGALGLDAVYGNGILDIDAAFQPIGATMVASTQVAMGASEEFASGSAAMGDALSAASLPTIVTDRYDRAFSTDLATHTRNAAQRELVRGVVDRRGISRSAASDALALAVTVGEGERGGGLRWARQLQLSPTEAEGARVLAAKAALRIAPDTQIGFTIGQGADGLVAQMQGAQRPAFLIAPGATGATGFVHTGDIAMASRRTFGDLGLTVSAERGEMWLDGDRRAGPPLDTNAAHLRERRPTTTIGVAADGRWNGFELDAGLSWLSERETLLGGRFNPILGLDGADTVFLDAGFGRSIGRDWRVGGAVRAGMTMPRGGAFFGDGSRLVSDAWSFDLTRRGFLSRSNSIGVRVAQPLRVSGGAIRFDLPVDYDYGNERAIYGRRDLSLTPSGREVMSELNWSGPLGFAHASASVFYRVQPGHIADAPSDVGALVTLGAAF